MTNRHTPPYKTMPRHTISKLLVTKDKEKIFIIPRMKKKKKKTCDINRRTNIITAYCFSETMEARRQWDDIFKMLREWVTPVNG